MNVHLAKLPMVLFSLAAACSGDVDVAAEPGSSSTSTTSTDGTSSSTGHAATTHPPATTTIADESGPGAIYDVGATVDLGGQDPVEATCDNIQNFPGTSVGCEFWAVQVPSYRPECGADPECDPDALTDPFGIGVGNPSSVPATVVIDDMRGPGLTFREITSVVLAPGESRMIVVNDVGGELPAEDHMLPTQGLADNGAFRVTSDVPIDAMQIYPVGGAKSYVAEASLLLPTNSLSTTYVGLGYLGFGNDDGWVVVVAIEDHTTVTVDGIDIMLDAYDTWTFQRPVDATGTFVIADHPIAAFSGTACTNILPGIAACDHLEEQLVPLGAWGTSYVATPFPQRLPDLFPDPDPVLWRFVATTDFQTVTIDPPLPGIGGEIVLDGLGDAYDLLTATAFVATSDDPFMLVQYMTGGQSVLGTCDNYTDTACMMLPAGDPWMIQATPVDQWLEDLPFLTDTSYPRDFLMIVREAGTTVTLDCLGEIDASHFTAVTGTSYEVGHVDLDIDGNGGEGTCVDGQQHLHASAPIGVMIGGIDNWTSYGYPGGLRLGQLWVPPTEDPG